MKDRVRFAVIGCGTIAPWHANGICNAPNAELTAVFDTSAQKANKLASGFGNPKVYTDLDGVLGDPAVDAVSICVPSGLHSKIGLAACAAGKHILCEKPLDTTLERIDALVDAASKAGVKLGAMLQRRTSPLWQSVHEAVKSERLGKLVLVDGYFKYYRSQDYYNSAAWRGTWGMDGGGVLMNQSIHCVDLLRWIAGEPASVVARCGHLARDIEVEDTAAAVVTYQNGALGVIEGTTAIWRGLDHRLQFHGVKGNIIIEGDSVVLWDMEDGSGPPEGWAGGASGTGSSATDIGMEGHQIQIEDFADAIIKDRPPMITGEEARKAVELILGIYKSSNIGQPVTFPL